MTMNFRCYDLQTYGKLDLDLLEDRLHTSIHAENILNRDYENETRRFEGQSALQIPHEETPLCALVRAPQGQDNRLYNVLVSNEFNVEDKSIRRIKFWPRQFGFFGERVPTYEARVLFSGQHQPLIALHHYLVTDPRYLVKSAKDVTQAHWFGKTEGSERYGFRDDYITELEKMIRERFGSIEPSITKRKVHYNISGVNIYSSSVSLQGPIEDVIKLRDILRTGFHGMKIIPKKEKLSFS